MAQAHFVELFPFNTDNFPRLTAYAVEHDGGAIAGSLAKLAYQFKRSFTGAWVASDGVLLADKAASSEQIALTRQLLQAQNPDDFGAIEEIRELTGYQVNPLQAADYLMVSRVRPLEHKIHEVLRNLGARIDNGYVMREHQLQSWVVDNHPALSLSVYSHLLYDRNLQQYIDENTAKDVIGIKVMDRLSSSMIAHVTEVSGTLADHRERLMELSQRAAFKRFLKTIPDTDTVVKVQTHNKEYDYPASALRVMVRSQISDDWARFGIDANDAYKQTRLAPDVRATIVSAASDVLKNANVIGGSFNSRTHENLFRTLDFMPSLQYGDGVSRPYNPAQMGQDFVSQKLFAQHKRYNNAPLRIGVIDTLDANIGKDFLEIVQREIESNFGFRIEVVKERNVRVVSEKNIASAVRAVEKEEPHLILAFFPNETNAGEANAEHLKSLTLGKGIASHVIYESTMNNPNALGTVVMGIFAKTGNTPFALAEPLEYTNFVVGLDLVRENLSRGDRITAMSRIYRNDGTFVEYIMDTVDVESNQTIPFQLLQTLFPKRIFEGQQVIIHHNGHYSVDVLQVISQWADVLQATFSPVSIIQRSVPRIYALDGSVVTQPNWGSIFILNSMDAFVVASVPSGDSTPQPLHIHIPNRNIAIEQAVYSVLAWTLLHYGAIGKPKLPVTIQHATDLAQWLTRGMLPTITNGDVPFWL